MKKIFLCVVMFLSLQSFGQHKAFKVEVYGKGRPIILIPDYACSGDVWKSTIDALKQSYELHVLTPAGFAGVPPVGTPILKTVKNELIKYIKDSHLNKPVLIGHGLGAFISLWVASEEPSLFSKILCADGVPFISAMMDPSVTTEQIKNNPSYNAKALAKNFKRLSDKEFEEKQFQSMLNLVSDSAHAKIMASWGEASDRKTLAYSYVEMGTTDLRDDISKINIPILILGSTYGTKEMSQKIFNEEYSNLKNKAIVIANTKHFIMYDDPIFFLEEVKNFLINGLAN